MNIVFLVFSYSSYFRCGWQEHVYKNNRPKEIQCQKNAVFQPTRIVRKQECVHCDKGNLLKGFDKKTVRREDIEPIKRVLSLYSLLNVNEQMKPHLTR